jgi:hypothetical protein
MDAADGVPSFSTLADQLRVIMKPKSGHRSPLATDAPAIPPVPPLLPGTAKLVKAVVSSASRKTAMKRRPDEDATAEPSKKRAKVDLPNTQTQEAQQRTLAARLTTPPDPDIEISNKLVATATKNNRQTTSGRILIRRLLYLPDWYDKATMEAELIASKKREKKVLATKANLERMVQASTTWDQDLAERERIEVLKGYILDATRRFFAERIFRYDVRIEMHRLKKNGPEIVTVNGVRRPIGTMRGDEWRKHFGYRSTNWRMGSTVGLTDAEADDVDLLQLVLKRGDWEIKEQIAHQERRGLHEGFQTNTTYTPKPDPIAGTHTPGLHPLSAVDLGFEFLHEMRSLSEGAARNTTILTLYVECLHSAKKVLTARMKAQRYLERKEAITRRIKAQA